jgi:hypothetical protein
MDMIEYKHCPKCNQDLPRTPEYFYFYHKKEWTDPNRFWVHPYCRTCENKIHLAYNNANYIPKPRKPKKIHIYKRKLPTSEQIIAERELRDIIDDKHLFIGTIPDKPGVYDNPEQKRQVARIMRICGWNYNHKNQIWYKPNLKSINNKWKLKTKVK